MRRGRQVRDQRQTPPAGTLGTTEPLRCAAVYDPTLVSTISGRGPASGTRARIGRSALDAGCIARPHCIVHSRTATGLTAGWARRRIFLAAQCPGPKRRTRGESATTSEPGDDGWHDGQHGHDWTDRPEPLAHI